MSYDLYFIVPEDRDAVSIEDFAAHFGGRPRYRLDGAQAIYRNENTGVTLSFDYVDPEGDAHDMSGYEGEEDEVEAPLDDGWKSAQVSVSVNYLRPHVFGLEAAAEIEAFVGAFDLSVDDPQTDGMGRGAFTREAFFQGWNEGNRLAYQAAVEHFIENNAGDPRQLPALPTQEIETHWRWNHAVDALEERLGENVAVPSIRFLRNADGIRSFVVWTDAARTAIPRTDLVVLVRDAMAPKRGLLRRRQNIVAIVPHADVVRALEGKPAVADHVAPYQLFDATEPTTPVLSLFESAAPIEEEPEGVRAESVLNQEPLHEAIVAAEQKAGGGAGEGSTGAES